MILRWNSLCIVKYRKSSLKIVVWFWYKYVCVVFLLKEFNFNLNLVCWVGNMLLVVYCVINEILNIIYIVSLKNVFWF